MPPPSTMSASVLPPNQQTTHKSRENASTPSPSYFGIAVGGSGASSQSSAAKVVKSASPSKIGMRSAAASPPHTLPFHTNPDYDAFRNQIQSNTGFALNRTSIPNHSSLDLKTRSTQPSEIQSSGAPSTPKDATLPPSEARRATVGPTESSPFSRSVNKRALSSSEVPAARAHNRRGSRSGFPATESTRATGSPPLRHEEKCPRLSLPKDDSPAPTAVMPSLAPRSETLPETFELDGPTMINPQHVINILDSQSEESLILDLRVSTQYARARIVGAFNLCVPTTLLKRSSYNVDKLAETVVDPTQRSKFENWRSAKSIIVYDGNSSQLQEASSCLNIIKKFSCEGWNGDSHIIRGGFFAFSRKFPDYIEHGESRAKTSGPPKMTLNADDETLAPVVGGCPMPATKSAANPFFGNIRQNMDLIGGVGQMSIRLPASLYGKQHQNLPLWLREVSEENDGGKTVSERFLQIEKREQKRMQEALSGTVDYGSGQQECAKSIQIAGIEQGSKNRYNNIWPFEHSRVKLRDVPAHGCDYINANFVHTSLSSRNYIATQGPIPATFEDFWNMVWQRDIRVIVMLTAESEGGQVKAHNYWSQKHYGPLRVKFVSEHHASLEPSKIQRHRQRPSLGKHRASYPSWSTPASETSQRHATTPGQQVPSSRMPDTRSEQPFVHVRKFLLSHESQPFERMREITQLQYSSWPDFGAPAHPRHLLGLVEQCDAVVDAISTPAADEHHNRPILVHCSAGCGRTGTFCAVDTVLDILRRQHLVGTQKFPASRKASKHSSPRPENNAQKSAVDPFSSSTSIPEAEFNTDLLYRNDIDFVEKTVEEFRLQRLSMVQSLRQFVLCYETVLEWISDQLSPSNSTA